jgi:hypothetical protein
MAEPTFPSPNPDRPHPNQNMVPDPRTGELVPAMELLDEMHLVIRMAEIARQAGDPQPEPIPLEPDALKGYATDILGRLETIAQRWGQDGDDIPLPEDQATLRNYRLSMEDVAGRLTSVTVQLVYPDPDSVTATRGNFTLYAPSVDMPWPREYFTQLDTAPTKGRCYVYSSDYPYHEEELARAQRDNDLAVAAAYSGLHRLPSNN